MTFAHIPVMLPEVLHALDPKPGETFIDGTLGGGGHAERILEATGPDGALIGFDLDPEAITAAKSRLKRFGKRVTYVNDSFRNAAQHVTERVDGILLDLGVSSHEIDTAERGFSFKREGPLDMRLGPGIELTAKDVVNSWTARELEEIFREYGEEKFSKQIAERIVEAREVEAIETTTQLEDIVFHAVPSGARHGKIHPATRVFQALRIAVNDELGALEEGLRTMSDLMKPEARIAVISFHSLEDRIVKHFMRSEEEAGSFRKITKKPIVPSEEEVRNNPRSRSAKLRASVKAG